MAGSGQVGWEPAGDAEALQRQVAALACQEPIDLERVRLVAGLDVADRDGISCGAVTLHSFPGLELLADAVVHMPAPAPYVPGMFAFREGPVLVAAMERLDRVPDVLLVDGAGLAHPRRAGLATHLGVALDLPTVGCAKSRLLGTYGEVQHARGAWSPLRDGGETVGAVLRTQDDVRPLFVSAGHRADLASAVELVLRCATRFRIPEPLRAADHAARAASALLRQRTSQ